MAELEPIDDEHEPPASAGPTEETDPMTTRRPPTLAAETVAPEVRDLADELPLFLRVREAADVLGVSTDTIRRRIATGQLRAFRTSPKRGGSLRIARGDMLALLASMRVRTPFDEMREPS